MYRVIALVFCLACLDRALALDPHKNLHQYGHHSWQTDNGLPQNTVHAVLQTRDGYIWLATEGGLVRFDSTQFVVFGKESPAHLPSNSVNSLFEDSHGDLWIGTQDGLVRRRGSEFKTFAAKDGLPDNTVWSVLEGRSGAVWVVTAAGVARYRNGGFEPFPIAEGLSNKSTAIEAADGPLWIGTQAGPVRLKDGQIDHVGTGNFEVQALAGTSDGRVWVGTHTGLESFAADRPASIRSVEGLPSKDVLALLAARDGRLWIGTANGLSVLQGGRIRSYTTSEGLPSNRIAALYEDREGAIWISTSRGLARIFAGRVEAFNSGDELSGNTILSIYEDREGSLWLGTESGGVDLLRDQKFTGYTTANGLSDDLVRSVYQDRSGIIWVGTNAGGLDRFDHGRFSSLTTADGLSSNIVLALGDDAEGNLWVGTPDGLDRIRDGHTTVFTSADGLADDFVRSIHAASDGSLWVGTRHGLSHLEHGRFTTYTSADGLGSDLVGAITEDRSEGKHGSLWIGTLGGLSHFENGKITTINTRDGLASNIVTALYQDPQGTLWIGTNGGGLNRLSGGEMTRYSAATELPENIYSILEDARGNLWFSSNTGIYRASKKELEKYAADSSTTVHTSIYGTADGMKISECSSGGHPAAYKLHDGTFWFATLKGIAAIDPEHLALNTVPPPVVIEQVSVDDEIASGGPLVLPPGHSRFSFQYAALSFVAPQKVRFRYKLEGFDKDWVDAGVRRTAYYTSLPPGKYRFRVIACNNDGVWNEAGAAIQLRLKPHYYQTYWFYLLLALGLALLGNQVYRWRVRQVELRFAAVLGERGRIAREIHDTLAQSLVGISVQLELVSRLLSSSAESAKEHLDQARILVRNSLTEARTSIWDLRSQSAGREDLVARLTKMAAEATAGSAVKVQSKISGAYRPLATKAEAELVRIAQEAVTNAVRHANPCRIAIELRFDPRQLQMTIQDDGCGFDGLAHPRSSGPNGHFGLTGMRERAELIGGTLTVESAPGKGTEISVQVAIES